MHARDRRPRPGKRELFAGGLYASSIGNPFAELLAAGAGTTPSAQWNRVQAVDQRAASATALTAQDAARGAVTEIYAGTFKPTTAVTYRGRTGFSENVGATRHASTFGGSKAETRTMAQTRPLSTPRSSTTEL